ncbi:MAG: VanZ family protein [Chitinophagaceae bacterium]
MKFKNNWNANKPDQLTTILLTIYLAALLWIVVFKLGVRFSYMASRSVNMIPFSKPSIINGSISYSEMIFNAVIFVPLGIYAGALFRQWTFGKSIFVFFFISLLCEALQFTLRVGASDITDIITNTSGGTLGLMLYKVIEKILHNNKAQKFINIIASIGTIITILLLLLLKLNMLPIRYQ